MALAHDDMNVADIDDGRSEKDILEGIKTSMGQALRGEGRPVREVLDELNDHLWDEDEVDDRTWEQVRADVEKHRWTPPPGAKSSIELLREDRDA